MGKKLCVFAGAGGPGPMMERIEQLGRTLVKQDWDIWFGGSSRGCMGALARGVLGCGGNLTGVLPDKIAQLRHYPDGMRLITTPDMASRKALFGMPMLSSASPVVPVH
jgi:predicted Rossmann-fold nucleotide-binding protein